MPVTDKETRAAYNRAYQAANKERIQAKRKEWYLRNKQKVIADRLTYKSAHRDKINAQERARYHEQKDIKREQWKVRWKQNNKRRWQKMLSEQTAALGRPRPEVCEACGGNDGGIVFDHCHELHHARGWLCDRCNVALGCLRDDIPRLRKLIAYLQRTGKNTAPQLVLAGI
jgi:hypothetical protein